MAYKDYETCTDFGLLKTLLDDGYKIIAFAGEDLVTIQKAGEKWLDTVAYGYYGEDIARNCYKGEDFYDWCKKQNIHWVIPTKHKDRLIKKVRHIINNVFGKEDCPHCGGKHSVSLLGADENGHNVYMCKYCEEKYVLL